MRPLILPHVKNRIDASTILADRHPFVAFPPRQRARVHVQPPCEFLLRQGPPGPVLFEGLADSLSGRPGVVTQEPDDRRHPAEARLGVAQLPIGNRSRVRPDAVGYIALRYSQIQTAFSEVISNRPENGRVRRIGRFSAS